MAKVITLSRNFLQGHPKAGQPTWFIEKFWKSLYGTGINIQNGVECYQKSFPERYIDEENIHNHSPKHHTIRPGSRFKTGDKASIRCWSGKPYRSKQLILAPDVEVDCFDFQIIATDGEPQIFIDGLPLVIDASLPNLAQNDGLTIEDFKAWFKYPSNFDGQIICWNKNIKY